MFWSIKAAKNEPNLITVSQWNMLRIFEEIDVIFVPQSPRNGRNNKFSEIIISYFSTPSLNLAKLFIISKITEKKYRKKM